ncbi:hypothetical protein ACFL3I_14325 [Pseudomonadota bacterium]
MTTFRKHPFTKPSRFSRLSIISLVSTLLLMTSAVWADESVVATASTNTCKSNDLIMASSFEEMAEYQITFTSSSSALFTATGQQAEFTVQLQGPDGQPADAGNLEWCLEDNSLLDISPNGASATVTSTGFDITSVDVIVRDPVTHAKAKGIVLLAQLQPDVNFIQDSVFISGATPEPGQNGIIRLLRNTDTEALLVGMVIVDGTNGLLVRILAVTLHPDYIDLEVERAGLLDLFDGLSIDTTIPSETIQFETVDSETAIVSQLDRAGNVSKVLGKSPYDCTGGIIGGNSELPKLKMEWNPEGIWVFEKDPADDDNWEEIIIGLRGSSKASLILENADVEIFSPNFKCSIKLGPIIPGPGIVIPIPTPFAVPIPLKIGFNFQMKAGFDVEITIEATTIELPSPELFATFSYDAGMGWSKTDGTFRFGSFDTGWGYKTKPAVEPKSAYGLKLYPYVGSDIEVGATIGQSFELAAIRLFQVQIGAPINVTLPPPLSWRDRNYVGPSWDVHKNIQFEFSPKLGDKLEKWADSFGAPWVIGELDIETPLFDYRTPWLEGPSELPVKSPSSVDLTVNCDTPCRIDPNKQDYIDFRATAGFYYESGLADVDLVGWKGSAQDAEKLRDTVYQNRSATGLWAPTQSQLGTWDLAVRWSEVGDLLNISHWFPYASNIVPDIEVAETRELTIQKVDAQGNQIAGGTVRVYEDGVLVEAFECNEMDCKFWVRKGDVALDIKATPGWKFVKWADDSQVCSSPESVQLSLVCEFTMDSDKIAKAVFEESFNYTLLLGFFDHNAGNLIRYEEYRPGDSITVYNNIVYNLSLKLDGEKVPLVANYTNGYSLAWTYDEFPYEPIDDQDYNYPDYEYRIRDRTNLRDVVIPLDLTISNQAYREVVGETFPIDRFWYWFVPGDVVTFYADGSYTVFFNDGTQNSGSYEISSTVGAVDEYECEDGTHELLRYGSISTDGRFSTYHDLPSYLAIGAGILTPEPTFLCPEHEF